MSIKDQFLFLIVFNILSEDGRKGALYELLFADDLILMSETRRTGSTIHTLESSF